MTSTNREIRVSEFRIIEKIYETYHILKCRGRGISSSYLGSIIYTYTVKIGYNEFQVPASFSRCNRLKRELIVSGKRENNLKKQTILIQL